MAQPAQDLMELLESMPVTKSLMEDTVARTTQEQPVLPNLCYKLYLIVIFPWSTGHLLSLMLLYLLV